MAISTTTNVLGTAVGAVVAVATAPIWIPFLGLGAAAAVIGTAGVAVVGAAAGYLATKPTPEVIVQHVQADPQMQGLLSRR